MKNILVIVVMAVLVGCAQSPAKLERSPCANAIEGRSSVNPWE